MNKQPAHTITYIQTQNEVTVELAGKIIGSIKKTEAGYQYFEEGQDTGGRIYASVELLKRDLEITVLMAPPTGFYLEGKGLH